MKITQVVFDYPPARGGAAVAVHRLALELASRGHVIDVLSSCLNGQPSAVAPVAGIRVHRFRAVSPRVLHGPVLDVRAMGAVVKDVKPDILHFHGQGLLHNDLLSWMRRDVPQVFCGHGTGWSRRRDAPWHWFVAWEAYDRSLGRRLVRRARRVVALTHSEVPYWSARGIPQSRIRVIPWGIEPDCFEARDGAATRRRFSLTQPVILSVGSLIDAKGPQHLIQALPSVVSSYPGAALVFCGPTTRYIEELKKLASSLNIIDRVRFLGFVERAELLNLYAACDVFALPSAYEGFGIAIAEAMACGKPVIAGDAGATHDLLGGDSAGITVRFGDVAAITNALLRVLAEPQLALALGTHGRQLAAGYSWEEVGRQYETLYGEVLAGT